MKRLFTTLLFAIMGTVLALADDVNKEERSVTAQFTRIEVSKGANLSLIQCDTCKIEVVTQGCPTSDVETSFKNDALIIKMKKKTAGSAVQVYVYFKDIDRVDVKTGASVTTDCLFQHKGNFTLDVSAKCEAEMEIETDELTVDANSCIITMSGKATKQTVRIAGTVIKSKYDALSLRSEYADIKATGCEAMVNVSKELTAETAGGTIEYKGDATVNEKTSFGGEVKKL